MPGKYRPVSTAEKRAQLEAAGEEWPIGSDGLPKIWSPKSSRLAGGTWVLRSTRRAASRSICARYRSSPKGRARRAEWLAQPHARDLIALYNKSRIFVGNIYVGNENQFPAPREVVETTLRRSFDELRAKQAAEKEELNESVA